MIAFLAVSSSVVPEREECILSSKFGLSECTLVINNWRKEALSLWKAKKKVVQSLRCKDVKELAWDYEGSVWQQGWIYPELKGLSFWIRPDKIEWAPLLHDGGVGMCNSFSWPGVHLCACDKAGPVSSKMVLITRLMLHLSIYSEGMEENICLMVEFHS